MCSGFPPPSLHIHKALMKEIQHTCPTQLVSWVSLGHQVPKALSSLLPQGGQLSENNNALCHSPRELLSSLWRITYRTGATSR